MQSQNGWQHLEPYNSNKMAENRRVSESVVDYTVAYLDPAQYLGTTQAGWTGHRDGGEALGASNYRNGDEQLSDSHSMPPPPLLSENGYAGPSNLSDLQHNPNPSFVPHYGYQPYRYPGEGEDGTSNAMSRSVSNEQLQAGPKASVSKLANQDQSTPLQVTAISTVRHYPNGLIGPSLRRGMACVFCRKRKLRCNAERPECSNCIRYKRECEYMPAPAAKYSEEDLEGKSKDQDGAATPDLAPSSSKPNAGRSDSSSSLSENLISPTTSSFPFNTPSFPPRMGHDHIYAAQQGSQPMGPPGFSTSPDLMAFPQYQYQYPFTPQSHQPMATPQSLPLPLHAHAPAFDPSAAQFAQYGTLGYPAWTNPSDTPPYSAMPTPIPQTPFNPTPSYHIHRCEGPDVKPILPITPTYPHHSPAESLSPPAAAPSNGAQVQNRTDKMRSASSLRSMRSTPDPAEPPPPSMWVDPNEPYPYNEPPAQVSALYIGQESATAVDPIGRLTEQLGEFLITPAEPKPTRSNTSAGVEAIVSGAKRKKQNLSAGRQERETTALVQPILEHDGLTNERREELLAVFLPHSRLFFEMSVPRFRLRLTYNDRRRPSLALLNAMYLWASRMAAAPNSSPYERGFYIAGFQALESQYTRVDRLVDGMRAAMLLGAYAHANERHYEGYILSGFSTRLVTSTGLHQIPSLTFTPAPPRNPLLRQKKFLLPPPEDEIELAERIHTFWAVFTVERSASLVTGFTSTLRDEDILTPFPRPLVDIVTGNVTRRDDLSVRDLYRFSVTEVDDDFHLAKWLKALTLLERATKMAFLDPAENGEYAQAWSAHYMSHPSDPLPKPPAWMNQPRYRCPEEYRIVKFALDQFSSSLGIEGIFPVERKRNAQMEGAVEPFISSHTISLHYILAAAYMFLHDVDSMKSENTDALAAARKCVALFRYIPQMPLSDVDSTLVVIWGMVTRVLIKEMHRLRIKGDMDSANLVEEEADLILRDLERVGAIMGVARTQAMGLEALKAMDSSNFGEQ